MKIVTKKTFSIILLVIFILLNLIHIIFPIWLIIEDIKAGTVVGTNIELAVLYPWIIEILSLPLILLQIVLYFVFIKVKYTNIANLIFFLFYVFQIIMFNILLFL